MTSPAASLEGVWRRGLEVGVALAVGAAGGAVAHLVASGWEPTAGPTAAVAAAVLDAGRPRMSAEPADAVWRVEVDACGTRRQASLTVLRVPGRGVLGVTNLHVVAGAPSVRVRSPGGPEGSAQVVGAIPARDLAVVSFAGSEPLAAEAERVASSPGGRVEAGEVVRVVGHPGGAPQQVDARVRAVELRSALGVAVAVLVLDREASPGSSGSGVFDEHGRVVGVVAARDPRTGSAVAHFVDHALVEPSAATGSC